MRPLLLPALAISLFLGHVAHAETFTVTNTTDTDGTCSVSSCSLREAINAANALNAISNQGQDVTFAPEVNGTILLGSVLPDIALSDLNISAPSGSKITLDAQKHDNIFFIRRSVVNISGLSLTNTSSQELWGSAIGMDNGALNVTNCTFTNNKTGFGGAINCTNADLKVIGCTFTGNSANFGGAIFSAFQATVTNSTFSSNRASFGGAIYNNRLMTIEGCTITGNKAGLIANNGQGGGIATPGSLTLNNSIVAGNSTGQSGPDISGAIICNYSLIQQVDDITFNISNHNITGIDPLLAPLADNGGPTQTFALQLASPALNAGDPAFDDSTTPYDQRGPGFARKKGNAVDIGAYEFQDAPPSNLTLNQNTVAEKQTLGAYVGSFITTDPDPGDTFTYALTPGTGDDDNAKFFIRDTSLRAATSFDVATRSSYSIRVKTTDAAGLSFTKQFTIIVTEATPPTLSISSPTANQKVLFSDFNGNLIRGTASDNVRLSAVKVRLSRKREGVNQYWNGTAFVPTVSTVDATVTGSTSANWKLMNVPPANLLDSGPYQVEAYALDTAGNKSATATRTFTLGSDFIAPSVDISTPTPNQKLDINSLGAGTISGLASDDMGVATVKLKLQRKRGAVTTYWNGSAFTTTPATVNATVTVVDGTNVTWSLEDAIPASQLDLGGYTVYATASDAAGNLKTSPGRSFFVVTSPKTNTATTASAPSTASS